MKKVSVICITALVAICLIGLAVYGIFQYMEGTQTEQTTEKSDLIKMPDVKNVDVDTAKTILTNRGLIPSVKYEYGGEYDTVIRTEPAVGIEVEKDSTVIIYVSKGYKYKKLSHTTGYMKNVTGIASFSWGDNGTRQTKGYYTPYVKEGYLYIEMFLACKSTSELAFYGDFGTASINDTFDKTVPIDVIYKNKKVNNEGAITNFTVKIPLENLDVQKPTNIYIQFDFTVNGVRRTFEAGFDLHW